MEQQQNKKRKQPEAPEQPEKKSKPELPDLKSPSPESSDKIDWNEKDTSGLETGITRAYRAAKSALNGDYAALEKLLADKNAAIDWNMGPQDKDHENWNETVAYLALKLALDTDNSALLQKLVSEKDVEIDWNKCPRLKSPAEEKGEGEEQIRDLTVASLAMQLALKGNTIALHKMLSDPKAEINWHHSFPWKNEVSNLATYMSELIGPDKPPPNGLEAWVEQLTNLSKNHLIRLKSVLRSQGLPESSLLHCIDLILETKFPPQTPCIEKIKQCLACLKSDQIGRAHV